MSDRVHDAAVRAQALDITTSFIVQAPAGSGKTELLMQRYLSLLASVDAPEEIIAITFTKKATGEMRERILLALDKAAYQAQPEAAHERKTWNLAQEVLERDQARRWQLQKNPNRLRILTIDALCGSLTRQMPLVSGMGVSPAIETDASEAYQQAARATLRGLDRAESVRILLAHLDNNWMRLEGLLISMLMRRDHWLRHLPMQDDEFDAQREVLESSLADVIDDHLAVIAPQIPDELKAEWVRLADTAAANLRREGKETELSSLTEPLFWPQATADHLPFWRALIELVLTGSQTYRSRLSKNEGFPSSKNKVEKAECDALKADAKKLIEKLAAQEALLPLFISIRNLPQAHYSDDQWQVLRALFSVLKLAVAHLRVCFAQLRQVDFTEVSMAAVHALGDEENPSDLALALDYRIQHILVDEFQDTSVSQYTLLERLTQAWQEGDGRSLFVVGDPMQSIYRFREAEVGLFLNVQRSQRLGQIPMTPLRLEVNFRSEAGVVDWVNETFSRAMPTQDVIMDGAVHYAPSTAFNETHQTCVQNLALMPDDAEAQAVAEIAAQAINRNESVAVLVRSKSHLQAIIPALRDRELPFQAVEIEGLSQRAVIQDLMALTRALWHPQDRIAWLAILRAPWCGLRLNELDLLCKSSEKEISEIIRDENLIRKLDHASQARIRKLAGVMGHAEQTRFRMPFSRWVENTWRALDGMHCFESDVDQKNAQRFFHCLAQVESQRALLDLNHLENAVEKLFAQAASVTGACVQLMTVHKSKGLEFDTVILPSLDRQSRSDEKQLLQWAEWRNAEEDREALLLAPIPGSGENNDAISDYLKQLDRTRAEHEKVRLLYVAVTRAKKHCHLLYHAKISKEGEIKAPDNRSLLASIWPSLEVECHRQITPRLEEIKDNSLEENEEFINPFIPSSCRLNASFFTDDQERSPTPTEYENSVISKTESVDTNEQDHADLMLSSHIGVVVHRCLQHVTDHVTQGHVFTESVKSLCENRNLLRALLLESGLDPVHSESALGRVILALEKVVSDPQAHTLWSAKNTELKSEFALSSLDDQNQLNQHYVDLTFVDESGRRWIVDFKSSLPVEDETQDQFFSRKKHEHAAQIDRYADLFSVLESHRQQRAIYFPMLPALCLYSDGE